jgi:hypothetical protein
MVFYRIDVCFVYILKKMVDKNILNRKKGITKCGQCAKVDMMHLVYEIWDMS